MHTIVVRNPANGEVVGEVPAFTRAQVEEAVAKARAAQPAWAALGVDARAAILRRFQEALIEAREEVAALATRETGKPFTEALGTEVLTALDATKWCVTEGVEHLRPRRVKLSNPLFMGRRSVVEREPLGVVGIVSPWNYPLAIPAGQAVAALLAGNAVVLKPASFTPLTALKLRELMTKAGLPEDVLLVTPGRGAEAGDALVEGDVDHL
ncbi:MAG TPA: aldehyde dehydrogenase family protein, partial [Candidatus Thermoplasmatota archaeon]|nr:aldehyde dehydrogenase family protein [Candidatus Thermoplasmatota archaeon]